MALGTSQWDVEPTFSSAWSYSFLGGVTPTQTPQYANTTTEYMQSNGFLTENISPFVTVANLSAVCDEYASVCFDLRVLGADNGFWVGRAFWEPWQAREESYTPAYGYPDPTMLDFAVESHNNGNSATITINGETYTNSDTDTISGSGYAGGGLLGGWCWVLRHYHNTAVPVAKVSWFPGGFLSHDGMSTVSQAYETSVNVTNLSFTYTDYAATMYGICDSWYDYDFSDMNFVFAPIDINFNFSWFSNYTGGRWYVTNDGIKTLVVAQDIGKLDYKIDNNMMLGLPTCEAYPTTKTPTGVTVHTYQTSEELKDVCYVPKFDAATSGTIAIDHKAIGGRAIYERVNGVDTELVGAVVESHIYNTVVSTDIWTTTSASLLVIKGYEIVDTASTPTDAVSVLDNPFVTNQLDADAAASWSFFPAADNDRLYTFTVRDDPSLRCGNIVQLQVDDEYLDVLLLDVDRSFDGAGIAEWKAVYIADTEEVCFPNTAVANVTTSWDAEDGMTVSWDNVTGYDDWDNPLIVYLVYQNGTLVRTIHYPTHSVLISDALESDVFSVATSINSVVYAEIS